MKVLVIGTSQWVLRDINFCLKVRYPDIAVISVAKGLKGVEMVEVEAPELVMVDSSLTDIDTPDLISRIRDFSDVPIVILSDEQADKERIWGLEAGADEYIIKPFSPIDLLARVTALLRRAQALGFKPEHSVLVGSELTINFTTHEVLLRGEPVKLTPIEFHLLSELARHENRVVSHRILLERVWGSEYIGDSQLIKKHIYRLRSKLGLGSRVPQVIFSERGLGYKFVRPH